MKKAAFLFSRRGSEKRRLCGAYLCVKIVLRVLVLSFLTESCSYMIAAEQKARSTYDNILRLIDNPDVIAPIRFLREREIVHFQRFGEALRICQDKLNEKNFYAFNPGFDNCE